MAKIALEGIQIFGKHGVFPEEKENGNEFIVDVWLETAGPLPETDELEDTLDYGVVYQIVEESFIGSVNLLETLVLRIGTQIQVSFESMKSATVRVSKINPPVAGQAALSSVEETFLPK